MNKKVFFQNIKPHVWEHSADKAAFSKLKKVPGLDKILRTLLGGSTENSLRLAHLASSVKVSQKQFRHINEIFEEVCAIFGVTNRPEIYISQEPFLNTGVIGTDNPFIVIKAEHLELYNKDDEIRFLLGHELGLIMSGYSKYKTLLDLLLKMSEYLLNIPLSGVLLTGVLAALKDSYVKAQWSADRAGLLAVQNANVASHFLMKMAGGIQLENMDFAEILKQAQEYKNGAVLSGNLHKIINILGETQSFATVRLSEIVSWISSGEYDAILAGNYPKKQALLGANLDEKEQEQEEEKGILPQNTNEFLNKTLKQAEDNLQNASKKAKDMFDKWFQMPPD